jgi:hypothetical protein
MKIIKYVIYAAFLYVIAIVALEGIVILADHFGYEVIRDKGIEIIQKISFTKNKL